LVIWNDAEFGGGMKDLKSYNSTS